MIRIGRHTLCIAVEGGSHSCYNIGARLRLELVGQSGCCTLRYVRHGKIALPDYRKFRTWCQH